MITGGVFEGFTEAKVLTRQTRPTMYFAGVKTGGSAALRMFPAWARLLGLQDAPLIGLDFPLDAPDQSYRDATEHIKSDPLSLGALITSHKIRFMHAAGDLFDELTAESALTQEISCIYKRNGRMIGHATDPSVSGSCVERVLDDASIPPRLFQALCLGAGGAGQALLAYFAAKAPPERRPARLILSDCNSVQLRRASDLLSRIPSADLSVDFVEVRRLEDNDALVSGLPPYSLVVNATGLGKDQPGSPVSAKALFPEHGVVWELNYRGELEFLRQARAQQASRHLTVADGWQYFLSSWALIVGLVFNVSVDEEMFKRLSEIAESIRQ